VQFHALAVLDPSFFQTNVAIGGGGVQGEVTVEMARNSAQTKADASIAKARAQVLALGGSIEVPQKPAVEEATQELSRKWKSATARGAIASSPEYREDLRRTREANEAKVAEKKAKREERTRTFLLKWAPLVEKADDLVLKHAPTSAAELGALLKVGSSHGGPPRTTKQAPSPPRPGQFAAAVAPRPRPPWRPATAARMRTRARRKMVMRRGCNRDACCAA